MKIIVAPDSFKGSCSSENAAKCIKRAINKVNSTVDVVTMPIADGGEGMVEAIAGALPSKSVSCEVLDPIGRKITARYLVTADGTAIIEMARASGLTLLDKNKLNPLVTTTYGTGQLIKSALNGGAEKLIIGLGGSATNDAGAGVLQALGASLKDSQGNELPFGGAALHNLASIDLSNFDSRIKNCDITMACDVTNPLCGEFGATHIYGPQKGVNSSTLPILEAALSHFGKYTANLMNFEYSTAPGSGAAGGLGFALSAFCGAKFASGIDIILDICGFDKHLESASLVITGEGRIDSQSIYGKAVCGIAKRAQRQDIPVVVLAGSVDADIEKLYEVGITAAFSIMNEPNNLSYAIENVEPLLFAAAQNVVRLFLNGL